MSEENVEVVRRGFDAFTRGDIGALAELGDPDLVSCVHPRAKTTYHGVDGALQMIADWTQDFDEFEAIPEDYFDAGEVVVVRIRERGRGKGSGVPVEQEAWFVFALRDGKAMRWDIFYNRADALKAAGLSESR